MLFMRGTIKTRLMMSRCKGKTKAGDRCKKDGQDNGYCHLHQDQQGMYMVDLPKDASYKQPPEYLDETGIRYWRRYLKNLQGTDFTKYAKLGDLCYWEQRKNQAINNLEKGKDVFVYRNKDGSVKHVQPSAFFTNLRNIQSEINTLRDKLFSEVKEQKESPVQSYKSRKSKNF